MRPYNKGKDLGQARFKEIDSTNNLKKKINKLNKKIQRHWQN